MNLTNPTGRRTEARVLHIAGSRLYFSYETLIAMDVQLTVGDRLRVRRNNSWGPTTNRHLNEMGCSGFHLITDESFERLENALMLGVDAEYVEAITLEVAC